MELSFALHVRMLMGVRLHLVIPKLQERAINTSGAIPASVKGNPFSFFLYGSHISEAIEKPIPHYRRLRSNRIIIPVCERVSLVLGPSTDTWMCNLSTLIEKRLLRLPDVNCLSIAALRPEAIECMLTLGRECP